MLTIRLQRIGRRHEPSFRVVVTEKSHGPKSRTYVEQVGFYNAKTGRKGLNKERIQYWISKGAQTSDTIHNFLIDSHIVGGAKINVVPKRKVSTATPSEMHTKESISSGEPAILDDSLSPEIERKPPESPTP